MPSIEKHIDVFLMSATLTQYWYSVADNLD